MRLPWLDQVVCDHGTEFMAVFAIVINHSYNIAKKPMTVLTHKPTQVGQVHQTMGNALCAFNMCIIK